jgi:hypothetical protein
MKIPSGNPTTMKNNQQQTNFFFSAYPLQTFNLPAEEKRAYLHIYKTEDKGLKRLPDAKILPVMIACNDPQLKKSTEEKNIEPEHIEERESDWFASYE